MNFSLTAGLPVNQIRGFALVGPWVHEIGTLNGMITRGGRCIFISHIAFSESWNVFSPTA